MVRKWLPEEGSIPADIWVEIIPFFETRNYIEKIFTYKAVYRQRLGLEPERLSDLMPVVFSEKAGDEKMTGPGSVHINILSGEVEREIKMPQKIIRLGRFSMRSFSQPVPG